MQELRPTGLGGTLQAWPFCADCWEKSRITSPDIAGYIALLYAIFERDPRSFRSDVGPIEKVSELIWHPPN